MLIIKDTKNDTKIKTNNGVYVAIAEDGTAVAAHLDGIKIFQVKTI